MSKRIKDPERVDPSPKEADLEDLTSEWTDENCEIEGRKPTLGELEGDLGEN